MSTIEKFYALVKFNGVRELVEHDARDTYVEAKRDIDAIAEDGPDFLYGVVEKRSIKP
jgi:hypothetical protein